MWGAAQRGFAALTRVGLLPTLGKENLAGARNNLGKHVFCLDFGVHLTVWFAKRAKKRCGSRSERFRLNDECRNPNDESMTNDELVHDQTQLDSHFGHSTFSHFFVIRISTFVILRSAQTIDVGDGAKERWGLEGSKEAVWISELPEATSVVI